MSKELEALFTTTKEVEFNGVKIKIKEPEFQDLPKLLSIIQFLLSSEGDINTQVMTLIREKYDDVISIISTLTEIEKESVAKMSITAIVFITSKIISFNADLIKKNLLPVVKDSEKEIMNTIGLNKSNS